MGAQEEALPCWKQNRCVFAGILSCLIILLGTPKWIDPRLPLDDLSTVASG